MRRFQMPDFRAAHHWLRGFSHATMGRPSEATLNTSDYDVAYHRGYQSGLRSLGDTA